MFINGSLYSTQASHNNECVFMPDKECTNPPFPVINDLTLEESLVRTTQLIFINYCQDNPLSARLYCPDWNRQKVSTSQSEVLMFWCRGAENGQRTQNKEHPLGWLLGCFGCTVQNTWPDLGAGTKGKGQSSPRSDRYLCLCVERGPGDGG